MMFYLPLTHGYVIFPVIIFTLEVIIYVKKHIFISTF